MLEFLHRALDLLRHRLADRIALGRVVQRRRWHGPRPSSVTVTNSTSIHSCSGTSDDIREDRAILRDAIGEGLACFEGRAQADRRHAARDVGRLQACSRDAAMRAAGPAAGRPARRCRTTDIAPLRQAGSSRVGTSGSSGWRGRRRSRGAQRAPPAPSAARPGRRSSGYARPQGRSPTAPSHDRERVRAGCPPARRRSRLSAA